MATFEVMSANITSNIIVLPLSRRRNIRNVTTFNALMRGPSDGCRVQFLSGEFQLSVARAQCVISLRSRVKHSLSHLINTMWSFVAAATPSLANLGERHEKDPCNKHSPWRQPTGARVRASPPRRENLTSAQEEARCQGERAFKFIIFRFLGGLVQVLGGLPFLNVKRAHGHYLLGSYPSLPVT